MAKTYSAGGIAHGAKYWRLTIDVRESDGKRRCLTKTTKIACAKNGTRGRLAALTALRQWRGEICALRWQNWDEDRQMLLIRHTLAKGENGGFVLRDNSKDPSGRGAFRDIPVPSTLATALAAAREAQRERIRGFGRWSPSLFICGNPLTGAWLSPKISRMVAAMSLCDMPRAYIDIARDSVPERSERSRGTDISTSPTEVLTFLGV